MGIAINTGKLLEDGIGGEIIAVEDKWRRQRGLWQVGKMGIIDKVLVMTELIGLEFGVSEGGMHGQWYWKMELRDIIGKCQRR